MDSLQISFKGAKSCGLTITGYIFGTANLSCNSV